MIQKKKIGVLVVLLLATYMPLMAQTFGRYADCTTGRGICGIGAENMGDTGPLRVGSQKFFIRPKTDSTLELLLVKANITRADEYKIFGGSLTEMPLKKPAFIYIDDAVPLAEAQRNRLGMAAPYNAVASGIYAVIVTETFFISELKLQ